ncbi:thioredoxin domain-containing protein [Extibacter muris]|uniref:thioredoxin domain-containing protein n=1 Tax=Extibacter muris TaxID=1796622 RepID=UPI001D069F18|nr:thioredoxin domain-containing protein [Extibacter muris]MCB6200747.1 thioredoxin domain-containing protein [Extibacter muris]MCQ4665409.1 thioredoxin domain-containing protein [Extibacter muris]MCQ4694794.1 thioredoxin domain-containing protein [Extibacter muris]
MNHLINEKSPYLLQHAENPVNWYPWGNEAFERAKKEDLPVFLSIGYSTCHWCHVMAHESFEDQEVAELLNSHYVCIKVDREERPDIDSVYMAACQAVTGAGGWPLTAILTPDQKPFFLGTYIPKHPRYGQTGLLELLQKVHLLWSRDREKLSETGRQITAFLSVPGSKAEETPDKNVLKQAVNLFKQQYDRKWGGFGSAPKFPSPHNLLFLLDYSALESDDSTLEMALHTLSAMARGGMNDQIGGGFSRYSTDERWLVPHFEKMLYDNALLAISYLKAYHITGEDMYADTAKRTLDYVLRELTGPSGEFYCGQDADSDGVEGRYYYFTKEEVLKVLGPKDGAEFCRIYDITSEGNFEGKCIPNRIDADHDSWPSDDSRLKKLYGYRLDRVSLHRDDKVILSWNGWMIIAMARAAQITEDSRYRDAAVHACQFIKQSMTDSRGRLYLRWRKGEAATPGQLDDYAVFGLALIELYRTTYEPQYLEDALHIAAQMTDLFEDKENGGYFLTASDAEVLIARPKETYDGAIPSGNSAAAVLLVQLAQYTCDVFWQEARERQIRYLAGSIKEYPAGHSFGLLALIKVLYPARELVCVSADSELPETLRHYLMENNPINLSVILKTKANEATLEKTLPYVRDYPIPGKGAMYYLCKNGVCMAPVEDISKLH